MRTVLIKESGERLEDDHVAAISEAFSSEYGLAPDWRVNIIFLDDKGIEKVNAELFGLDEPTDVISLNLDERFDDDDFLWGEIYVSTQTAKRVAREMGNDWKDEALLYIVHGLLHLLGMEDSTEDEQDAMWKKQLDLMSCCGYSCDSFLEDK